MVPQSQPSVNVNSVHPSLLQTQSPAPAPARTAAATRARTTHGLYSADGVVPGEDRAAFAAYRCELIECLQPGNPAEAAVAEQMAMAHRKLQRLWAQETGIYAAYDRTHPPQGDESHPLRLAQCFLHDCANGRGLDRLSLQQQRLMNAYHKAGARLMAMQDLRRKGFMLTMYMECPALDDEREPPVRVATPSHNSASGENADRGASVPAPSPSGSRGGVGPAAAETVRETVGKTVERSARPELLAPPASVRRWNDAGSGENADRGESTQRPPAPAALVVVDWPEESADSKAGVGGPDAPARLSARRERHATPPQTRGFSLGNDLGKVAAD